MSPAGKRALLAVGGTFVVAAGVVVVILVLGVKHVPEFTSLAEQPDPSLHGTVAYVRTPDENGAWCVDVVAASGAASKEVTCGRDYASPTLAWGEDGRLTMTVTYPPPARATVVDVVTGATEDLPVEPTDTAPWEQPYVDSSVSSTGEQALITSDGEHTELVLSGPTGKRVLVSVSGPDFYSFTGVPVWSPDGSWIVVQDTEGRLLLVTTGEPARVGMLATDVGYLCETSTAGSCLATTSSDVLTGAGT